MSASAAVAVCTCSQVIGWVDDSAWIRESWMTCSIMSASSSQSSVETPDMSMNGMDGLIWVRWLVMAWTSSGSTILAGVEVPVGYRDRASGVLFLTPGMCIILKR